MGWIFFFKLEVDIDPNTKAGPGPILNLPGLKLQIRWKKQRRNESSPCVYFYKAGYPTYCHIRKKSLFLKL